MNLGVGRCYSLYPRRILEKHSSESGVPIKQSGIISKLDTILDNSDPNLSYQGRRSLEMNSKLEKGNSLHSVI